MSDSKSTIRLIGDKLAIILSGLCVVHCLLLPFLILLMPALSKAFFSDESFHVYMVIAVIPISLMSLFVGCHQHKRYRFFILGSIGLISLVLAILLGHDFLSEMGETALTILGSIFIAYAHYQNYKMCHQLDDCECSNSNSI